MAPGNPFAAPDDRSDLLASGGLHSDAADWHKGELHPTSRPEPAAAAASSADGEDACQRSAPSAMRSGATGVTTPPNLPLLPPYLVDAAPAGYPPDIDYDASSQGYLAPQASQGLPPPPVPGASKAWGGGTQPGLDQEPRNMYSSSRQPPPLSSIPPPAYQQGATWTTSAYPTDRPSYQPFEQAQAGGPLPMMRCWGLGEMWMLFILSFIIWPGWYVASVWYCVSPKLQAEPRHKVPFILNCIMSAVFTLIWVGILFHHTWSSSNSTV